MASVCVRVCVRVYPPFPTTRFECYKNSIAKKEAVLGSQHKEECLATVHLKQKILYNKKIVNALRVMMTLQAH